MSPVSTAVTRGGRRSARQLVRTAARLLDRVSPPSAGVVILAYHQVGAPNAGSVNVPSALFDEQMAILADERDVAPVISLDEAVDLLESSQVESPPSPPSHRLVITFDDGTADFVENAVPILEKYKLPVTLYVATDFVERERSFWDDGTTLSWAALRDVLADGLVSIGTHTHTHALLDRVSAAAVAEELERSVGLIGERLGVDARHLAYPKALAPAPGDENDRAVRRLVSSAAIAGGRPNRPGHTDTHRLSRTSILVDDDLAWFARKARGGLRLEGEVRERVDRRRYAGATK